MPDDSPTVRPPDIHAHRILILDFGAQYTQLIARRVREARVYCEIHPCDVDDAFVRAFAPKGVILSGSHMSAYEESTARAPQGVFGLGVPVLQALNRVNPALGFESGLVIVVLAILLDRMLRIERK